MTMTTLTLWNVEPFLLSTLQPQIWVVFEIKSFLENHKPYTLSAKTFAMYIKVTL
jgi:hypothetical protein